LQDPSAGSVLLDGRGRRGLDLGSYRRLFGTVGQDTFLFQHDRGGERLPIPDLRPDPAVVDEALRVANAWAFVQRRWAAGRPWSSKAATTCPAGQRQRLAIARAIYAPTRRCCCFDEATSALDTESEQLVQAALDRQRGDRTALVIAHRLSTVIRADRIVCLKDGRIEGVGPHAELLESCAEYRKLHDLQFRTQEES
jgi:ABC-type multidrug transport system fused ATPase/permease subunit